MPLIINTNTASLNAQRNLGINQRGLQLSLERLSSGYRINRAGDDAAGLMISEGLRAQIRGSKKALDNVQDGINVLQYFDGVYQSITNNLQRIRELSAQAVSDTYRGRGRSAINLEINQLLASIDQMALGSQFNGIRPLTGTVANMFIQVGPNNDPTNDRINIISAFGDTTTNVATGLNLPAAAIFNSDDALVYIGRADNALNIVNTRRSTLGAMQNRLESAAANLMNSVENLAASESRIRNVDVASESAEMMRFQILQQASASILSQANQMPSLALKLLGN